MLGERKVTLDEHTRLPLELSTETNHFSLSLRCQRGLKQQCYLTGVTKKTILKEIKISFPQIQKPAELRRWMSTRSSVS